MDFALQAFNILIGGEAGQGLVSIGNILIKAIAKTGWHLFAIQDYESRIRGGHNFIRIRVANKPVFCGERAIDLLVALDDVSLSVHADELKEQAIVIYDPTLVEVPAAANYIGIKYAEVAANLGQPAIMANAAAAGAAWALLSDDLIAVETVLSEVFKNKGQDIVDGNIQCARAGFNIVRSRFNPQVQLEKPEQCESFMVIKGNEALPCGALAAGLKFMSAYPMTPSTGVTEFIALHSEQCGVVMEQAEDEIAAVNMVIGAAFCGVRAMTATSGGGFALMTEALGLAGSAEIPIVVIDAQRPGPSTGLPTRTEQGDLLFAVYGGSGDFPRAVLAPGDVEEAFYVMGTAFNLAEKYQMPVIVLSDQYLADSYQTVASLDPTKITINRGDIVTETESTVDYLRYRFTESGISPRLYPGVGEGLVVSAGDEHDEAGHLIEDAHMRTKMMQKRMQKLNAAAAEALEPVIYGNTKPELMLIGWGSTKGVIREAVDLLSAQGCAAMAIHLPQVYPLSTKLREYWEMPSKKVIIENNYSGQLQKLLSMELSVTPDFWIRKYDGRPFFAQEIVDQLVGGEANGRKGEI